MKGGKAGKPLNKVEVGARMTEIKNGMSAGENEVTD